LFALEGPWIANFTGKYTVVKFSNQLSTGSIPIPDDGASYPERLDITKRLGEMSTMSSNWVFSARSILRGLHMRNVPLSIQSHRLKLEQK
jgi:hypothetical protein